MVIISDYLFEDRGSIPRSITSRCVSRPAPKKYLPRQDVVGNLVNVKILRHWLECRYNLWFIIIDISNENCRETQQTTFWCELEHH